MTRFQLRMTTALISLAAVGATFGSVMADDAGARIEFVEGTNRLAVVIDGLPVAVYYQHDKRISRPFFAHVRTPDGIQVTRNHPPVEGQDLIDHDSFHPGIWMSFGDISGSDYWRTAAQVRHAGFAEAPKGGRGKGSFAVRNEYLDQKDPSKVNCEEVARFTFTTHPAGYLLLWDSTFSSDREFSFGDQEEMGLGFRVATPIRVEKKSEENEDLVRGNGTILDSEGRKNGDEVWGNSADWCDYSGEMAGQQVGVTLFCHLKNFRPSWFHARDYGLLEANPFGRQAFGKGEKSTVVVKPGENLRLRFGVLVHSSPTGSKLNFANAYQDYLKLAD
jgi:hypothetical protein